ncbi:MAG: M15 family metallopeptidase [Microvirga sp.]
MALIGRSLRLGLVIVASFSLALETGAKDQTGSVPGRSQEASKSTLYGPSDVYQNIPERDELGRDQLAMFREWNPDPLGNHEENLKAIHPLLAKVVRKAEADNPGLRVVAGSGRRDYKLQQKAVAWGWSRTQDSPHRSGTAIDLWPLNAQGRVHFDPAIQSRVGAAMKRAAAELGVSIRWGGHFHSFKDMDRSHFELARH